MKVRAIHGATFSLTPGHIPLLTLRDIKPLWTCAEVVWFLSGGLEPEFMEQFGFKVWSKFAKDGKVMSATGFRWRTGFDGIDQLGALIEKLKADPSNRQGVLLSWDPRRDTLHPGPNAPCVMIWHVHAIQGQLHMSVLQRSADMYFGLPHDILGSRLIQELLAAHLGMQVGGLMYAVSNAHLYEDQWEAAEEMIARVESSSYDPSTCGPDFGVTALDAERALRGDVETVFNLHDKVKALYNPWPPITGPKLVL